MSARVPAQRFSREEFYRKLIHLSSLAVPALYVFVDREWIVALSALGLVIAIAVELLRLKSGNFRRQFERVFGSLLRLPEHAHLTGATYLVLGFLLTVLVFPRQEAIFGMCVTGLADAAAALVGRNLGRHPLLRGKTLEGSLAFWLISWLVASLLFPLPLWLTALVALVLTFGELFWQYSTDNLFLPLAGAGLIWLVHFLFRL